jgi:zinc-ribbon domain
MFCDQCGAQLDVGQRFCNRCGKEIRGPVVFAAPRPGRVAGHIRLLGILWLALSALDAVGGVAALVIFAWVFGPNGPAGEVPAFVRPLVEIGGIFSIVKACFGFLAGWGLLNRQPWARSLALAVGVVSLFFHIPFGTALGIYTLWVLLPAHSEEEYEKYQKAGAA